MIQYLKTTASSSPKCGQFFAIVGELAYVVCTYDFNPCLERLKNTPELYDKLKCVPSNEAEFLAAKRAVEAVLNAPFSASPSPDLSRRIHENGDIQPEPHGLTALRDLTEHNTRTLEAERFVAEAREEVGVCG